jgi:hypothetical protein
MAYLIQLSCQCVQIKIMFPVRRYRAILARSTEHYNERALVRVPSGSIQIQNNGFSLFIREANLNNRRIFTKKALGSCAVTLFEKCSGLDAVKYWRVGQLYFCENQQLRRHSHQAMHIFRWRKSIKLFCNTVSQKERQYKLLFR